MGPSSKASIDDNYNGRNNVVAVKKSDYESSDAVAPVQERVAENVTVQPSIEDVEVAQEKAAEESKPAEMITQSKSGLKHSASNWL